MYLFNSSVTNVFAPEKFRCAHPSIEQIASFHSLKKKIGINILNTNLLHLVAPLLSNQNKKGYPNLLFVEAPNFYLKRNKINLFKTEKKELCPTENCLIIGRWILLIFKCCFEDNSFLQVLLPVSPLLQTRWCDYHQLNLMTPLKKRKKWGK